MLADEIIERGVRDYNPRVMAPVIDKIKRAQKFQLNEQFAAVADELRTDLSQIVKALPLCRLPFELTWIEFAEAHRNRHEGHGAPLRWTQAPVKRIGFLFEAINGDLSHFKAYLLWENTPTPGWFAAAVHCTVFTMHGDPKNKVITDDLGEPGRAWRAIGIEERATLSSVVRCETAEYAPPHSWAMLGLDPALLRAAAKEAVYDWNGEPAYIEAVLALLNARNTSERRHVDNTAFNRKRAKRGDLPLSSHYVLTIHPRQLARARAAQGPGGSGDLRAHFVRGHWKVRASGIFFWSPHVRGNAARGVVEKDYRVMA